jgi:acyl dehydratase
MSFMPARTPAFRAGASVLFPEHLRHASITYATAIDSLDHTNLSQTHSAASDSRRRYPFVRPVKTGNGIRFNANPTEESSVDRMDRIP